MTLMVGVQEGKDQTLPVDGHCVYKDCWVRCFLNQM